MTEKLVTIEDDTEKFMKQMGDLINYYLGGVEINNKYGFMLLVTEFGKDPGVGNYISNCSREDMIKALREKADVLEQKLDILGNENDSQH